MIKQVILNLPEYVRDIDVALDQLAMLLADQDEDYIRNFLEEVVEPIKGS
jgi:hypothetical protein